MGSLRDPLTSHWLNSSAEFFSPWLINGINLSILTLDHRYVDTVVATKTFLFEASVRGDQCSMLWMFTDLYAQWYVGQQRRSYAVVFLWPAFYWRSSPFISVSVVRTSLNLRQVFERANLWLFWRRLDHKLEQRTEEIEACSVDCVRKQKHWSWTLLLFRRIHLMIHGDLGIHICIRWSIQSQYDLYSVWIVLSNLERPSNSQLYAYEICKRIDKEIAIYVTFVPFSEDNVCAKQPWN